jgi:hypothetical protein
MNPHPQKIKKTDTRSLARMMFSEAVTDVDQVRSMRDAAYKSGFAMAAATINNYIRSCARAGQPISGLKIKAWVKASQQWRNISSLDDAPEVV